VGEKAVFAFLPSRCVFTIETFLSSTRGRCWQLLPPLGPPGPQQFSAAAHGHASRPSRRTDPNVCGWPFRFAATQSAVQNCVETKRSWAISIQQEVGVKLDLVQSGARLVCRAAHQVTTLGQLDAGAPCAQHMSGCMLLPACPNTQLPVSLVSNHPLLPAANAAGTRLSIPCNMQCQCVAMYHYMQRH
jgi:hypothetical protein